MKKKGMQIKKKGYKLAYDNMPILPVLKDGEMDIFISESKNNTLEAIEIFRPEKERKGKKIKSN